MTIAESVREEAWSRLNLSNSELRLMAGEISPQELRTVQSILTVLRGRILEMPLPEPEITETLTREQIERLRQHALGGPGNLQIGMDFWPAVALVCGIALRALTREAPTTPEPDARRYRWLRDPLNNVALVLDKVTGEVPAVEGMGGGGYRTYEYRSGEELDRAIDAALSGGQDVRTTPKPNKQDVALPAQREGWVKVTADTLPAEDDGEILVFTDSGFQIVRTAHELRQHFHAAISEGERSYYTHWQALPAPPQGGK